MFTLHKTSLHLLQRWLSAIWRHRGTIAVWSAITLLMIIGILGVWIDLHLPE